MDANKEKKLHDIGFRILQTCALCEHGCFPNDDWGTCSKHSYEHLKHSESSRDLSVHKNGSCNDFSVNEKEITKLKRYLQFI